MKYDIYTHKNVSQKPLNYCSDIYTKIGVICFGNGWTLFYWDLKWAREKFDAKCKKFDLKELTNL